MPDRLSLLFPRMKHLLPVGVVFLLAGASSLSAQVPAAPPVAARSHSLSLNVVPNSVGGSTRMSQDTSSKATEGSKLNGGLAHRLSTTQKQTTSSKQSLQITVHNFAALPDSAQVEWYFVAVPAIPEPGTSLSEQQFVFDQGAKSVALQGNGNDSFAAESKEVTAMFQRKNAARMGRVGRVTTINRGAAAPTQSGSKLQGWLVRVVADGKVIAVRGSKDEFEAIAKDDKRLAELKDDAAPGTGAAAGKP